MSGAVSIGHMPTALDEARSAAARGEVPVGAVVSGPDGQVLARAGNRTRELNDPTAHAEIWRSARPAPLSARNASPVAI